MGDCFDLDRYRTESAGYPMVSPNPPLPLRKKTEPFLKGPIPLAWLSKAAGLGGSSLAVGLCLWFQHGVAREPGSIKVTKAVRRKLDLSPDRVYRGLNDLAAAGLIRFESRGRGHCPVVSILAIEGSGSGSLGYSTAGKSPQAPTRGRCTTSNRKHHRDPPWGLPRTAGKS